MILWAWYASFAVEFLLIVQLLRWRVRLPVFRMYLLMDLSRWILLATVNAVTNNPEPYRLTWCLTEPLSLWLLCLVVAEAYYVARPFPRLAFWVGVGAAPVAMALSAAWAPVQILLWARSIGTFAGAAVLCVLLTDKLFAHGLVLLCFLVIDFIHQATILAGTGGDPRNAWFIILGQTGCFLAWLVNVRGLRQADGLARIRPCV